MDSSTSQQSGLPMVSRVGDASNAEAPMLSSAVAAASLLDALLATMSPTMRRAFLEIAAERHEPRMRSPSPSPSTVTSTDQRWYEDNKDEPTVTHLPSPASAPTGDECFVRGLERSSQGTSLSSLSIPADPQFPNSPPASLPDAKAQTTPQKDLQRRPEGSGMGRHETSSGEEVAAQPEPSLKRKREDELDGGLVIGNEVLRIQQRADGVSEIVVTKRTEPLCVAALSVSKQTEIAPSLVRTKKVVRFTEDLQDSQERRHVKQSPLCLAVGPSQVLNVPPSHVTGSNQVFESSRGGSDSSDMPSMVNVFPHRFNIRLTEEFKRYEIIPNRSDVVKAHQATTSSQLQSYAFRGGSHVMEQPESPKRSKTRRSKRGGVRERQRLARRAAECEQGEMQPCI